MPNQSEFTTVVQHIEDVTLEKLSDPIRSQLRSILGNDEQILLCTNGYVKFKPFGQEGWYVYVITNLRFVLLTFGAADPQKVLPPFIGLEKIKNIVPEKEMLSHEYLKIDYGLLDTFGPLYLKLDFGKDKALKDKFYNILRSALSTAYISQHSNHQSVSVDVNTVVTFDLSQQIKNLTELYNLTVISKDVYESAMRKLLSMKS